MPITVEQIGAVLKAADVLEHLNSDMGRIVGKTALLSRLHDLDVSTTQSKYDELVKDVVSAVKQAKGLLEAAKAEKDAHDKISFASSKLKSACKEEMWTKLVSIQLAGSSEKGHGAVPYLDGAFHAHVTNTHSVAWEWRSGKVHVVAIGKKNNQNKIQDGKKTMEYDWDKG